jgi:hypothetical protein
MQRRANSTAAGASYAAQQTKQRVNMQQYIDVE